MVKHGCCADKACIDRTCMELPAGKTCGDCGYFRHCAAFYAHKATDTYCDFFPRRFREPVPPTPGVPATEPLRHATTWSGDCPHWCKACAAETAARGVNPSEGGQSNGA